MFSISLLVLLNLSIFGWLSFWRMDLVRRDRNIRRIVGLVVSISYFDLVWKG